MRGSWRLSTTSSTARPGTIAKQSWRSEPKVSVPNASKMMLLKSRGNALAPPSPPLCARGEASPKRVPAAPAPTTGDGGEEESGEAAAAWPVRKESAFDGALPMPPPPSHKCCTSALPPRPARKPRPWALPTSGVAFACHAAATTDNDDEEEPDMEVAAAGAALMRLAPTLPPKTWRDPTRACTELVALELVDLFGRGWPAGRQGADFVSPIPGSWSSQKSATVVFMRLSAAPGGGPPNNGGADGGGADGGCGAGA
mmetsp:Transcript_45794/g.147021  ORF Transcript_45794/g.147021 Transcript_45794/m.147021 type:complete len:256 (+) Transcript_45794:1886-2653(+)